MTRSRAVSLCLVLSAFVLGPSMARAGHESRVSSVDSSLQVCVDQKTRSPLSGDIELLLVMDNSLSLRDNDPDGRRFGQVETMLKSVHERISKSRKPRDVRFSFVTFAGRAVVEIPRSDAIVLSESNLDEVSDLVRSRAPGDQQNTDYVAALDAALDQMRTAPSQNCRVIVWFTDGAYWPSIGANGNTSSGGNLRESACGQGGFSQQLRAMNINIFPLYIEPRSSQSDESRKDDPAASRDVMAHLTGDVDSFGSNPYQAGAPCSALPTHVGEVLAAANVNQLGQFFVDLPNIIEGGKPVACPTKNGRVESKPMPSGRYVAQISIVKYAMAGKELTPADLRVRQPNGEESPLDEYFEGEDGRYQATRAARELQAGWIIEGSGEEHCIRAFPREGLAVQVRKSGGTSTLLPIGPSREWLEGEDLVSALTDTDADIPIVRIGNSSRCDPPGGFSTDASGLESAFAEISNRSRGVICVDPPGSNIFVQGVSLSVTREGQPLIVCESIQLRRAGADQFINADRTETSSRCDVDFRGSGTKFAGVEPSFTSVLTPAQAASCNIDLTESKVRARNQNELISFSIEAVLKENVATKCKIEGNSLEFSFSDANGKRQSGSIPLTIELDLQPEPDRRTALIATVLTVMALLAAALAILRRMTIEAAALVPSNKLCAVRFGAQATRTTDGRVLATIENRNLREVQIDMDRVDRARLEGSDSKLELTDRGDSVVIHRETPPLRWMLREPWAWVDDTRAYVVHPKGRRAPANRNLIAPFREAIIVFDDGPVRGSEDQRSLSIWVVKQKGAAEGDQIAIEELLKENGASVIDELLQSIGADGSEPSSQVHPQSVPLPPSADGPAASGDSTISMPPDWT